MHIISREALQMFVRAHVDADKSLDTWYRIAKAARWTSLVDVQRVRPDAEAVGKHTIFNIRGNTYRLITKINYRTGRIYIRGVLTHADYDKDRWK